MSSNAQRIEQLLVSNKSAIVNHLITTHKWMVRTYSPMTLAEHGIEFTGLDLRLNVCDGNWKVFTGDSQFDTTQDGYWGYGFLSYSIAAAQLSNEMSSLVEDMIQQVLKSAKTN